MKDYNYATLAEYYDALELGDGGSDDINKFLDNFFKKNKVKSVLDITCGTGAQAIYLHKKGYKITASDFSKDMVAVAQKKYKKLKFHQADMRTANLGNFDAVISIFNAIGHLSKTDFEKAVKNIGKNLNSGGFYIFDIFNLDFMRNGGFRSHEFIDSCREVNGIKFVRFNHHKFDSKKGIMKFNQKTYVQEGHNEPKLFKERWDLQIYTSSQLKEILERNGFEVVKFLNLDGSKFDKNKSLFILTIAKKK